MVTTRLISIGILLLAFVIVLLGNPQTTEIKLLVFPVQVPVFYLISLAAGFGVLITILFFSLLSTDKKLKAKLKKVESNLPQKSVVAKSKKSAENQKDEHEEERYKSPFY